MGRAAGLAAAAALALASTPTSGAAQQLGSTDDGPPGREREQRWAPPPAGPAVPVRVDLDPCLAVSGEDVRRIVAIELAADVPEQLEASEHDVTRVEVACEDDMVRIHVLDPHTGKELSRRIVLAEGSGTARRLALAIAELVSASWLELEATSRSDAPAVDATARPSLREAVRERAATRLPEPEPAPPPPEPPTLRIALGATFTYGDEPADPGWGGTVFVSHDPLHWLTWSVDARFAMHEVATSAGRVAFDVFTLGASLLAGGNVGDWVRLAAGPSVRVGRALLTGERRDPTSGSVSGPTGGPAIVGRAALLRVAPLTAILSIEAGWTTLPVAGTVGADGRQVAGADGPWLAVTLAVGATL